MTPFGSIDTPGQGATVSGVVVNFGWALGAPGPHDSRRRQHDRHLHRQRPGRASDVQQLPRRHRDAVPRAGQLERRGRVLHARYAHDDGRHSHHRLGHPRRCGAGERRRQPLLQGAERIMNEPDVHSSARSRRWRRRPRRPRPSSARPPLSKPTFLPDAELKLVRRITNGLTLEEMARRLRRAGYNGYLEMAAEPGGDQRRRRATRGWRRTRTLDMPTPQLYALDSNDGADAGRSNRRSCARSTRSGSCSSAWWSSGPITSTPTSTPSAS